MGNILRGSLFSAVGLQIRCHRKIAPLFPDSGRPDLDGRYPFFETRNVSYGEAESIPRLVVFYSVVADIWLFLQNTLWAAGMGGGGFFHHGTIAFTILSFTECRSSIKGIGAAHQFSYNVGEWVGAKYRSEHCFLEHLSKFWQFKLRKSRRVGAGKNNNPTSKIA